MSSENYVEILRDSLVKKDKLLDEILLTIEKIEEMGRSKDIPEQEFITLTDRYGEMAAELEKLDAGFTNVYNRVSEELAQDKERYKSQISEMQALIKRISDKTVKINATQQRANTYLQEAFTFERKEIKRNKSKAAATRLYRNSMGRTDTVTPQFMDKKN